MATLIDGRFLIRDHGCHSDQWHASYLTLGTPELSIGYKGVLINL